MLCEQKGEAMNDWMPIDDEVARRAERKAIIVGVCALGVLAIIVLGVLFGGGA